MGWLANLKKRFRTKLRGWLLDDTVESPYVEILQATENGPQLTKYLITGAIGLHLQGIPVSGTGQGVRLIREEDAVDREQFNRLQQRYLGLVDLVWEEDVM